VNSADLSESRLAETVELGSRRLGRLSDESLLVGLGMGDRRSAHAFVSRFKRRIYGLALTILRDEAAAEDVAQEALIRAWRYAQAYDSRRGTVINWLLTITRNLAVDAYRLRRPEAVSSEDLERLISACDEPGPAESAVIADERRIVRSAIRRLPVEQRRALVLSVFYAQTAQEISEIENIPLGTAKTRIRSGLHKLRDMLADGAST